MFNSIVFLYALVSILFTYTNITEYDHFILQVVFPTCASIMTFSAAIYSVKHKSNWYLRMLMSFMMLSSIVYMSAFSNYEWVQVIHGLSLLLSVSVLLHFLYHYVNEQNKQLTFPNKMWLFYFLPAVLALVGIATSNEAFHSYFQLIFGGFAVLAITVLFVVLWKGGQGTRQNNKYLLFVFVLPFVPYVYLYLLPQLIWGEPWLPVEYATLSLMLIFATFIFTSFIEQLLGKQIQFNKVRYYGYISMFTAVIIVLCITPFLNDAHLAVLYFLLISVVLHMMLYVKEQLDFNARRFMVTSDNDMTQYLFQVIHRLSLCTSKKQLYALLQEELHRKYRAYVMEELTELIPLRLTKVDKVYKMPLKKQGVVVFPHKRLSNEDIVWLELLFVYVDGFARSLDQIEELMQKLEEQSSAWLNTLLFQLLEKEKRGISQELHDTVLQELLHLARGVEDLSAEQLRETLHESAFELREYCEGLHPPLIDTHGLKGAIDKLIQKTKLRSNFLLEAYVEQIEIANPLFLYRIIQELLNNAMKHSNAQNVKLSLYEKNEVVILNYRDDGIGLTGELQESMGFSGIKERVKAMNGHMTIQQQPYAVKIEIQKQKESAT